MIRIFYIILLVFGISHHVSSQSTIRHTLAQPFSLTVQLPKESPAPLAGDDWGDFSVLQVALQEKASDEMNIGYKLLLVAYDTGMFALPSPANMASGTISQIQILAPKEEDIKEYAPVKELDFAPEEVPLWRWIAFIAGLLVIAYLLWYLWKNQKKPRQEEPKNTGDAYSMLLAIKNDWEKDALNSTQLGDGLVNSLRICYKVNTKRSTRQLMQAIQKDTGKSQESNIASALQDCDGWRFGKKQASRAEGFTAIESIEKILRRLKTEQKTETDI
jgi:hypothetical protein